MIDLLPRLGGVALLTAALLDGVMKRITMIRSSLILVIVVLGLLASPRLCFGLGEERFIANKPSAGGFAIVQDKAAARIFVDSADHAGVVRAAKDLQKDI